MNDLHNTVATIIVVALLMLVSCAVGFRVGRSPSCEPKCIEWICGKDTLDDK